MCVMLNEYTHNIEHCQSRERGEIYVYTLSVSVSKKNKINDDFIGDHHRFVVLQFTDRRQSHADGGDDGSGDTAVLHPF